MLAKAFTGAAVAGLLLTGIFLSRLGHAGGLPPVALDLETRGPVHKVSDGLNLLTDEPTGIRIGIPTSMAFQTTSTKYGRNWKASDGRLSIDTLALRDRALPEFAAALSNQRGRRIARRELDTFRLLLEGSDADDTTFYLHAQMLGGEIRVLSIVYSNRYRASLSHIVAAVATSFEPFPSAQTAAWSQAKTWQQKGRSLEIAGKRSEAAQALRHAVWLDPTDEEARQTLKRLRPFLPKREDDACVPNTKGDEAAPSLALSLQNAKTRVGDVLELKWSLSNGPKSKAHPTYLIMLMPEPARFEGAGFFSLTADASNPGGIKFGAGRLRSIVPLHTQFATANGSVGIVPFRVGKFAVEWAIVRIDACGEHTLAGGQSVSFDATAGAPELWLQDEFSDRQPDKLVKAVKGPFRLHVFKDHFEVYDETDAPVLRHDGFEPLFSPTGRFVVYRTAAADTYEVIDLWARRAIGRYEANSLGWSHGDSFLYFEQLQAAKMQIVRTLHGRRYKLDERVPTRREAKAAALAPGADMDEGPDGRRPQKPALDIEPHGTACGRPGACLARELWLFDLSLENGIVTFFDLFHKDNPPQVLVYDLAAGRENLLFSNSDSSRADFERSFAGYEPLLYGWEAGEPIKTALAKGGTEQGKDPDTIITGRLGTTQEIALLRTARGSGRKRLAIARTLQDPTLATLGNVIGPALNHLPTVPVQELRGGRDKAALTKIEADLSKVYSPKIVRFGVRKDETYLQSNFPDPNKALPDAPLEIDLTSAGRDVWYWSNGGKRYWMTQTVASGHITHSFSFSLIGVGPNQKARHAVLIRLANNAVVTSANRVPGVSFDESQDDGADGPFTQQFFGDARGSLGAAFGQPSIVTVSAQRYLTMVMRPTPRLVVFDLEQWAIVCRIPNLIDGSAAVSATFHQDQKHVTQINTNGAIHIYRCASGANVLNGAYVDDELVVIDRNGYFEGSEDAAGYLDVTVPGIPGRHLLSQFTRILGRTDVTQIALSGGSLPLPTVIEPPSLRRQTQTSTPGDMRLEASSTVGLRELRVFVDGRLQQKISLSGAVAQIPIDSKMLSGATIVTAVAVDSQNLVSSPLLIKKERIAATSPGRLFLLSVGIDKFPSMGRICGTNENQSCDLTFAAADARRTKDAIAQLSLYREKNSELLIDADASKQKIIETLERMATLATASDTLVVSFASHGLIGERKELQIALPTTDMNHLEATSLAFATVASILQRSRARVVVLLDVCQAGLASNAAAGTNDAAVTQLITSAGASMIILAASKGRQFSEETPAERGGRFTVALTNAITVDRKKHDADGDGAISVSELYRAIKSKVVRESEGRQTPWLSRTLVVGDFPVF